MTSSSVLRARAARLFGIGLALAGFLQVLLFTCRSLVPAAIPDPLLNALPHTSSAYSALMFASVGVVLIALGGMIARSQAGMLQAQKRRRQDASRRVQHYRDGTRIEPSFEPRSANEAEGK